MTKFSAADWLDRFVAAGGSFDLDPARMQPTAECRSLPDVQELLSEIRGVENAGAWERVFEEVSQRSSAISGAARFPLKLNT